MIASGPRRRLRGVGWKIVLTKVNTIGFERQGDIYPVVDYDLHAAIRAPRVSAAAASRRTPEARESFLLVGRVLHRPGQGATPVQRERVRREIDR